MNIFDMKELDQYAVDKIADTFGRVSCNCPDFGREIECTYSPMEDKWRVRKEVHGEEEMAKKENEVMKMPSTVGVVQRKNTTVVN